MRRTRQHALASAIRLKRKTLLRSSFADDARGRRCATGGSIFRSRAVCVCRVARTETERPPRRREFDHRLNAAELCLSDFHTQPAGSFPRADHDKVRSRTAYRPGSPIAAEACRPSRRPASAGRHNVRLGRRAGRLTSRFPRSNPAPYPPVRLLFALFATFQTHSAEFMAPAPSH